MTISRTFRLGDYVDFLSGFAFKSEQFNTEGNGIPVIRIRDVKPGHSSTYYNGIYDPKYVISDGDYVIGMDGEFTLSQWRGGRAVLNQRVCSPRVISPDVELAYVARLLPSALKRIEDATPFATVKHLSVKTLRNIELKLPSLPEQRRVVDLLDHVDSLRTKRRRAISLLEDLTQSIFLDMFGDPVSNPHAWDCVPMQDFLEAIDSGRSPKCLDRPAREGEWGVLKLGAVTQCVYIQDENKALPDGEVPQVQHEVKTGDLLLSRKNTPDLVGAAAYVRSTYERLLLPDLIFRLALKQDAPVDGVYLHALLTHPKKRKVLQSLASGSAASMVNISKRKLLGLMCEIPPVGLQTEFSRRVAATEEQKEAHRTHLAALDELFASIQHRAFSGIPWDHEAAA